MFVTFINEDKFNLAKEEQLSKSNEVNEEQPSNILSILITFSVLNEDKFNIINEKQL